MPVGPIPALSSADRNPVGPHSRPEGTPSTPVPHCPQGAVLGFRGKFLEQILAAGDRRAVQASGAAGKKPRVAPAEQRPEPQGYPQQPGGRHPHGGRASPGAEQGEAGRDVKRRGDAGRGELKRRGLEDN